jgi:hypothetical protein
MEQQVSHAALIRGMMKIYPFLAEWYQHRIRFIKQIGEKKYHIIERLASVEEIVRLNQDGYNVYFVVNTSRVVDKESGVGSNYSSDNHIVASDLCFVDFDLKDKAYSSKQEFIELGLPKLSHTPHVVVDSGNGIHAYWQVKSWSLKSEKDRDLFKNIQQRLIKLLNTDKSGCNPSRIMRLPGTYNVKSGWKSRKLCQIVSYSPGQPYSHKKLEKTLPPLPRGRPKSKVKYNGVEISDQLTDRIELLKMFCPQIAKLIRAKRAVGKKSRSEDDFRLGLMLMTAFVPDNEIATVISLNAKAQSYPDKVKRQRYVGRTMEGILAENNVGNSSVKFTTYALHNLI